ITGPGGANWADAFAGTGENVAKRTVVIGRDVTSPDGHCPELLGIGEDGALLVRPDGHIAWHSAEGSSPASALAALLNAAEQSA
ncbi:aromatic-ring hydroxylase C-terminal domain-containing protein, partial [Streptomyces mirabilis]